MPQVFCRHGDGSANDRRFATWRGRIFVKTARRRFGLLLVLAVNGSLVQALFSYLALILAPVVQESICILKTTFDEKVYTIKSDETNLLGYECNDTYRNHLHR